MSTYNYDTSFEPPAPVLHLSISMPLNPPNALKVLALVESGADITVIPRSSVAQLQLRRVDMALAKGFDGRLSQHPVFSVGVAILPDEHMIMRVISWEENYALLGRDYLN